MFMLNKKLYSNLISYLVLFLASFSSSKNQSFPNYFIKASLTNTKNGFFNSLPKLQASEHIDQLW